MLGNVGILKFNVDQNLEHIHSSQKTISICKSQCSEELSILNGILIIYYKL